jgi:CRISPR-associated endonuclease/helicase Cas3
MVFDAPPFAHVIRRRDVVDLFDTTLDLGGMDLDVSRFIREGDERDVHVFWRDFDDQPRLASRVPRGRSCAACRSSSSASRCGR